MEAANQLLAHFAFGSRPERASAPAVNALREELHRAGVAMRGWPAPTPKLTLAPGAAAVFNLVGRDADVLCLRAWSSLAAATRWAAAQWAAAGTGRPLDADALYGAVVRGGTAGRSVTLRLAGTPTPLQLPLLDLSAYDWGHVDLSGTRSALAAVFGVGELWRSLPDSAGTRASLGCMADALTGLVEQTSPPPAKAELLGAAAAELRRLALRRDAASVQAASDEHRSVGALPQKTSKLRKGNEQRGPAATQAPQTKRVSYAVTAATLTERRSALAVSTARPRSPSPIPPPTSPTRVVLPKGVSVPPLPAARPAQQPTAPLTKGPAEKAEGAPKDPLAPALAAVTSAVAEAAWALLDASTTGERPLAPHLLEPEVLRLLAAPPKLPLSPALAASVALWLRRLAAQPATAADFVAKYPVALQRWTLEEPLLLELGRLLGGRLDAEPPTAAVVADWLAQATAQVGAPALLQTLNETTLQHPLYGATLAYLQQHSAEVPRPVLLDVIELSGQKLANKRALGGELRQRCERALADLLDEVPLACLRLDFGKNPAWRILSCADAETQRAALQIVFAVHDQPGPNGNAVAPTAAERLQAAGNAASFEIQLAAAAVAFKSRPQDVGLAQAAAAILLRNKKALTAARSPDQVSLRPETLSSLLAPCIVAGKAWSGDAREAAQAVWSGLEAISFGVPYLVAAQRFEEAAELMHRAHGHPHLAAESLACLAASLSFDDAERLRGALMQEVGNSVACTSIHVGQLRAEASKKYITKAARTAHEASVAELGTRLAASVNADQDWMAACATHALLAWGRSDASGDALFAADGVPNAQLSRIFDVFAQRQVIAAFKPAERPIRWLVALLRGNASRRAGAAKTLLAGIGGAEVPRKLWQDGGLSLPLVEALLESTPGIEERRRLAVCFGEAYGLWPVVPYSRPAHAGTCTPGSWSASNDLGMGRAQAIAALLPALVHPPEGGAASPRTEAEREAVGDYVEAAIVHVLREPEQHLWRLGALLQNVADAGTLSTEALRRVARQAMGVVVRERLDGHAPKRSTDATASGVDAAWSLCQLARPDLQLSLALVDGVCDAIDTSEDPQLAYTLLQAMLRPPQVAPQGEAPAVELSAMRDALVAQLRRRTRGAGTTAFVLEDAPRRAETTHLLENETAAAPCSSLHQWLDSASANDVAQGYQGVVRSWTQRPSSKLIAEAPIQTAIEGIGYACIDTELRAKVLLAIAAHGEAMPQLNRSLLQAMAKRRPFTAAERSVLSRIEGYTPANKT